uniref:ATP-dependent RNA helicase n=2 Tax=Parascaris univalens TaxID=6257 RepID=A0A914ZNG2_PARUN
LIHSVEEFIFSVMPKIIAVGKSWRPIYLPGEFASDANLAFLSTFEELTPMAEGQHLNKSGAAKQPKKSKKRKRKASVTEENEVRRSISSGETTNEIKAMKYKKRMRIKLKKIEDTVDEDISEGSEELRQEDECNSMMTEENVADNNNDVETSDEGTQRKLRKKKKVPSSETGNDRSKINGSASVAFADDGKPKKRKRKREQSLRKSVTDDIVENEGERVSGGSVPTSISHTMKVDLTAWMPFCLPEEIMRALADLGFTEPTEIQKLVLPSAVRDKLDILGAAETGSGKTLAYAVPLIVRLLEAQNSMEDWALQCHLRALILAPTRELVVQIRKHINALIKYTNFKATSIVGGLSQQKQERLLKYRPEIVVATPGRFWSLAGNAPQGSYLSDWQKLLCLVVDETDRMVEKGHFEELEFILEAIKSDGNIKRQTLVFSATLTFVHPAPRRLNVQQSQHMTTKEKIDRLTEIVGLRKERKVFDITRPLGTAEALTETRMNCSNLAEKDTSVVYLLTRYPGRTLIFMNSVDASRRLYGILVKLQYQPVPLLLHARMIQKQRLKNLEKFAEVANSVLLATDVAARGLDIRQVEHVIHYQVPKTAELYVHRCGRTARASHRGLTVLMVDPQDAQYYRRICRNLNREHQLPPFPIDSKHLFDALKERVKAATEVESLEHRMKKISSRETWFEKTAREADLLLDGREREKQHANEELIDLRRRKKVAEGQLRGALALPLPRFGHVLVQKTRYVTPELASNYNKAVSMDALTSFEENTRREQCARKNYRVLLSTRHLRRLNDKRKRRKLKRKFLRKPISLKKVSPTFAESLITKAGSDRC